MILESFIISSQIVASKLLSFVVQGRVFLISLRAITGSPRLIREKL